MEDLELNYREEFSECISYCVYSHLTIINKYYRHQNNTLEAKDSEAVPNRYRPSILISPIVVI